MTNVHYEAVCNAPLALTFGYVDDYRNATKWMFGLSSFEPDGAQDQGLDAVFDTTFSVKPVNLRSTVQIDGWEQDALLSFTSIKGFSVTSTWRFSADGADRTKIVADFDYHVPGGLVGKALGKALEPIAAICIKHGDAALRKQVEELYQQGKGGK